MAAWALANVGGSDRTDPFGTADGWRLAGPAAPTTVELVVDGEASVFAVDPTGTVTGTDRIWRVHPIASEPGVLRLEVDDRVHEAAVRIGPHRVDVAHLGNTFTFQRPDAFAPGTGAAVSDGSVVAPMPGTLLGVSVRLGEQVEEGDVLGVLEAMKMELSLRAPLAGVVSEIGVAAGEQVPLGATLFVVEPAGRAGDG
jgi:acetyl-CoA/propionyl-CoA carboxylase biotin carboxyl carrier protein